jgi:FdhD protein
MMSGSIEAVPDGVSQCVVFRYDNEMLHSKNDYVAKEVPVAMVFNGVSHAVMMASPSDLEDFALGFSLTEGIIAAANEIYGVECNEVEGGIELHLEISAACERRLKEHKRVLAGRTGCGICGADSLKQVHRPLLPVMQVAVDAPLILKAEKSLSQWQTMQRLTGATHAAAWVDLLGNILHVREDVGRHNALDKLIGHLTRNHINPNDGFLMITSRASFEMVQKSVIFGAGMLVAVSAPTVLAVNLAKSNNLALAGYVRGDHLVAYAFPERFGLVSGFVEHKEVK